MSSSDAFRIEINGCRAGADWRIVIALGATFTLQPSDTLRMHIRERVTSANPLLRLSSAVIAGQGLISFPVTGPDEGSLVLEVDDALTSNVPSGKHVFDIEIDRAGVKDISIGGTIEVLPRITRGV
jgi:hypothetical protein